MRLYMNLSMQSMHYLATHRYTHFLLGVRHVIGRDWMDELQWSARYHTSRR